MSHSCHSTQKAWYQNKLFQVCCIGITLISVSSIFPKTRMLSHHFLDYLQLMWWPILLGLIIGGIIDHYLPRTYIEHILNNSKKRTILAAVALGFLLSTCSHGILAIAIQLYKKGASTASVISFLLASPWANLPVTILLIGFFGTKAFILIGGAILIAIVTGLLFQTLAKQNIVESNPAQTTRPNFSIKKDIQSRWKNRTWTLDTIHSDLTGILHGMWALTKMVLWWIIIGVMLASVAGVAIPDSVFSDYMGPTPTGLSLTLLFATILEVCSEGTSPLAFELYKQTGAFGNVFVFLMAGVATDYTEIGLLWSNVGKRTAILLPLTTVPLIILAGILINAIV